MTKLALNTEIKTAKLFQNGGSQAVRLPKDCRFEGEKVLIHREGDRVIIEAIESMSWSDWSKKYPVDGDLMEGVEKLPLQDRDFFHD